MKTSYVIVNVQVSDQDPYEHYKRIATEAVAAAGGEFIVRGGRHKVLEGNWSPSRMVMLRFPSYEQACAFYDSALYVQARKARAGATEFFDMIVVEGV